MSAFRKISFSRVSLAVLAVAIPAVSSKVEAATFTWAGVHATSGSWGQATNWTGGIPAALTTNDIAFPSSAVTQVNTLLGGAARSARVLSFGAALDGPFTISYSNGSNASGQSLTMDTDGLGAGGASALISVDADATGTITLGATAATAAQATGTLTLADNLIINHNGTGSLIFNRAVTGAGFSITKNGTGRWSAGVGAGGNELDTASAVNLNAGTLEFLVPSGGVNKVAAVPINVTGASTLAFNNQSANDRSLTLSGAGAFNLGADLAIENTLTSNATFLNLVNISRNLTGSGNITVTTANNVGSNADGFSRQRVQLAGDNSAWTGNLVVAKGTAQFSGSTSMAGTGGIVLGTTGDAFGAGLSFNQSSSDVSLAKNITVRSGGFRGIKNNNFTAPGANITLSGSIALAGTLDADHSLKTGKIFTISGNMSGVGGLNVTRLDAQAEAGTYLRLAGTNTFGGATTVGANAGLVVDGTLTSNISVASGGRVGGDGSTTGSLALASGALFIFNATSPTSPITFDVAGTVTLPTSFSVASLIKADGSAIDWTTVANGSYTLIGSTPTVFSAGSIGNFGLANAATVVVGSKLAYFDNGSLVLVVAPVPEPTTLAAVGCVTLILAARRRRD